DSAACADHYYNQCILDCEYVPPPADFALELEWSSEGAPQDWCAYNTPITGDIDGDGLPEIIGKPCSGTAQSPWSPYPNLLIVDGSTGTIEASINTPALKYLMDGPAIADIDKNGYAEIFIQASAHPSNQFYNDGTIINGDVRRRILCYEYDGTQYVEKWMSDLPAGYTMLEEGHTLGIADFDQDGVAEVYVQNMIFDGLTGQLLVAGGRDLHRGLKPFEGPFQLLPATAYSIAADVLPADACLHCEGLELVAGGMVYSVELSATSTLNVERMMDGVADGWTGLADVDRDGDLDAVVTSNSVNGDLGLLYVWDLQNPQLLFPVYELPIFSSSGYISLPNIADFDGDGFVEFGICTPFNYQVLKAQNGELTTLWNLTTDDWSGQTGSSVFDFNNDGSNEVVYRSESELQILEGTTGAFLAAAPCRSGTRVEYPVVVDADADGETEILCSCTDALKAFGSAGSPWVGTRRLWNQHLYFNVNINDDLSIPIQQQAPQIVGDSIVLNNFLTQYAYTQFPVANATVEAIGVDCIANGIVLEARICNVGEWPLSQETPIAFYDADPTQELANLLDSRTLSTNLAPDSCEIYQFTLSIPNSTAIYIVVNDDHSIVLPYQLDIDFPITAIPECNYVDNLTHWLVTEHLPFLQVEERILCAGDSALVFGQYQNTSGIYRERYLSQEGCDSIYEVNLEVLEPLVIEMEIEPSCWEETSGAALAKVDGGLSPYTYLWNRSTMSGASIYDLAVGAYTLTVTDANQCTAQTSFEIDYVMPLNSTIEQQDVSCFGANDGRLWMDSSLVGLSLSLDGINYQSDLVIDQLSTGIYDLFIRDEYGCVLIEEAVIDSPAELIVQLPSDSTIFLGCELAISSWVNSRELLDYQWTPPFNLSCSDCIQPIASPTSTTVYTLTVINESGCIASDEVKITVEKPRDLYIPNAFSPNGDGVNDVFMVHGGKGVEEIVVFQIFNRWGALVYTAEHFPPGQEAYGWSGWFKSRKLDPGVFTYWTLVKFADGFVEQYQGDITLMK
ncbi:MAG: gliding motility-associated C-terminal domain-containing protein, partial [Bacteroidota bacterium]